VKVAVLDPMHVSRDIHIRRQGILCILSNKLDFWQLNLQMSKFEKNGKVEKWERLESP
jgi:hypothetical protein